MAKRIGDKTPEISRFLALLENLGETPETIHEKTGFSERTINNYIWGDLPLGGQLLRILHQQFNVSVDWLLSGRGDMQWDVPAADDSQSNYLIPYIQHYDLSDAGDQFLLTARAIEGALIRSNAKPGIDYTRLDLFELAKPFVLQRAGAGHCQLVAKEQHE